MKTDQRIFFCVMFPISILFVALLGYVYAIFITSCFLRGGWCIGVGIAEIGMMAYIVRVFYKPVMAHFTNLFELLK